jgi:hypothetical protein
MIRKALATKGFFGGQEACDASANQIPESKRLAGQAKKADVTLNIKCYIGWQRQALRLWDHNTIAGTTCKDIFFVFPTNFARGRRRERRPRCGWSRRLKFPSGGGVARSDGVVSSGIIV